ncbi:hypothetical protein [uncultured Algibacter sp.]|uniref:hypothetical protein n=1 Tax=uncultured Algibacter sp. TaxID=298659 RepID=UPI0026034335|nr:hypothetical protein [uncultured Algibacter sp.]
MIKKMSYGYTEPEDCIEQNLPSDKDYDTDESEKEEFFEVPIYDFEKTKEENLRTGTKYLLVPISSDGFGEVKNEQLLSEFSKIILKQDELFECDSIGENLVVVDYATMFGLRLNRFKNYNSDLFKCDERVLFEFLVMKNRYFGFVPFFLSFPTINREMGIRKDRAVSIIKKFKRLGFLSSEIKTELINCQPRQITYYTLYTDKIIDLIPEIYLDEETEWDIKHDILKYLEPDSRAKNIANESDECNIKNIMQ